MLGKVLKSAAAVKAIQVVRREAAKPENQRKAKDMITKLRQQRGRSH